MEVVCIGSPIPADAQEKMTDDQWLSAMAKYAGVERRRDWDFGASGGEHELAQSLESKAKANPKRFVALTERMPASLPASYFGAILRGVAGTTPLDGSSGDGLTLSDIVAFVERVHALPGRPCGRWITHLVSVWSKVEWPPSVVEMAAWYATEDPDPTEEVWQKRAPSGQLYYGGDPDVSGLNSTRGSAANAIAALIFAGRGPAETLIAAVRRLAYDASIAVRSQTVYALLALLNSRPDLAIQWFVECVGADVVLLKARFVEHFLHYAGHRDYAAVRPVLQSMIASVDEKTAQAGARLCCWLALDVEEAEADATQVRAGTPTVREAAATIYATSAANKEVGAQCRGLLLPFFADAADNVRAKAASAFRHTAELDTADQAKLLRAFLDADPSAAALEPVIRAMEDSPVRLPDLVCRLIEAGIDAFKTEAGDIRTHSALVAGDLSKIVIRLYTQSQDEAIKTQCLNAIDEMEQAGFFGLADELGRVDR